MADHSRPQGWLLLEYGIAGFGSHSKINVAVYTAGELESLGGPLEVRVIRSTITDYYLNARPAQHADLFDELLHGWEGPFEDLLAFFSTLDS